VTSTVGWDPHKPWYHGSPSRLRTLRPGSTITQDRALAAAFAHKPSILSLEDDGRIRHNGRGPGWLHVVAEPLGPGDIAPHPRSSMPPGLEWVTQRELDVVLLGAAPLVAAELLSHDEELRLRRAAEGLGSRPMEADGSPS